MICSDARSMAVHVEASDSAVAATEFRANLDALGIAQHRVARLFGVGARTIKRWRTGDRHVPYGVSVVFRLLVAGSVSIDQVEQAAVAVPARINGSAKPGPPPLLVAPAPEQSATAPAAAAALAAPDLIYRRTGRRACSG